MERPSSPPSVVGLPVEHLFKDIYRLLDGLQAPKSKTGSIATHIARCRHELTNLERIHTNRWRFHPKIDSLDDPFQLRDTLNKFAVSCNEFKYVNSPLGEFDENIPNGCLPMGLKRSWKRKHFKNLETEFFGHERGLTLALSNAVYTTVLQMQRATTTYEATLAQILRRAERRHHIFECLDGPIRFNERTKLENFRMEEMDWELSLGRYMNHMESWPSPSEESVIKPSPSRSSVSSQDSGRQLLQGQQFNRRNSNSSVRTNGGDPRMSEELNTSIYYRPARRNSLHSNHSREEEPRTSSLTSVHSVSSTALVLYNSPSPTPPTQPPRYSSTTIARPVRRASISRDFHWEYVGRSSTFGMLAPLAASYPELKDAQADIFEQTQGMTLMEARAYARGRLASLPQQLTDEVQAILSLQNHRSRDKRKSEPIPIEKRLEPPPASTENWRRSANSDLPDKAPTAKQIRQSMDTLEAMRQSRKNGHRKDLRNAPKKFKTKVRELRPLTAISEKSTFTKSRASSIDKPGSRSLMQTLSMRKSSMSLEVPPVPDLPTLSRPSSFTEIPPSVPEEKPETPPKSQPSTKEKSSPKQKAVDAESEKSRIRLLTSKSNPSIKSTPSSKSMDQKPLPPNPKFNKSALLAIFKPRQNKDLLAPPLPNDVNLPSRGNSNASRESLRRVSMELLKRQDSKMTLFSVAEGLDVPFDMWLRALPYIEGRASSPRPPIQENSTQNL